MGWLRQANLTLYVSAEWLDENSAVIQSSVFVSYPQQI
jgi:hypothetical protein